MAIGFSKEKQTGRKPKPTVRENRTVQKRINPVSKKQLKELAKRRNLKAELIEESGGLCMKCGKPPDMKDGKGKLHLIHKIPLARGGKTNRQNCEVWCRKDHLTEWHHLKEV